MTRFNLTLSGLGLKLAVAAVISILLWAVFALVVG